MMNQSFKKQLGIFVILLLVYVLCAFLMIASGFHEQMAQTL